VPKTQVIKIGRRPTLPELERQIAQVPDDQVSASTELWIARDFGAGLFVESRVVALMATAFRAGELTVVDWTSATTAGWRERFEQTLSGVAAVFYASRIRPSAGAGFRDLDAVSLRRKLLDRSGVAERGSAARTATVFAPDAGGRPTQPLVLADLSSREEFVRTFVARMNTSFGDQGAYSDASRPTDEKSLGEFVFEVFQNTLQHGCIDGDRYLDGVRYVHNRRHILFKRDLVARATGFGELQEFLSRTAERTGQSRYLEVSVGDHGLGMVDRFLQTRQDYARFGGSSDRRLRLLLKIVDESLSSKLTQRGAGEGLSNALAAAGRLGAFVSIRTGEHWLYYPALENDLGYGTPKLRPAATMTGLAKVAGTHVNLLVRVP